MPVLSISEAVEKLIRAVEGMGADHLLDVHNEVFPMQPKSKSDDTDGGASDRRRVIRYIEQGLAIEEIIDLLERRVPRILRCSLRRRKRNDLLQQRARNDQTHRLIVVDLRLHISPSGFYFAVDCHPALSRRHRSREGHRHTRQSAVAIGRNGTNASK